MRDFTPVFDVLIKEYSTSVALVYGKVWRYCQGERKTCFASQSKIAKELGMGRTTVNESLSKLVTDKWLTMSESGRTREYCLTKKGVETTCSENEQVPLDVSTGEQIPIQETDTTCSENEHSTFKRELRESVKKEETKDNLPDNGKPTKKRKWSGSPPAAVEMVRRITHRYPPKKLHSLIDGAIGDEFSALCKWSRIVKTWIASGWSPINYTGMISVFRNGWNHQQKKDEKHMTPGVAVLSRRAHQRAESER